MTETIDEQNSLGERRVMTTEYRSSVGKGVEKRTVEVIHQLHPQENQTTSGGLLAGAAAAVESTLQSAKAAISKS